MIDRFGCQFSAMSIFWVIAKYSEVALIYTAIHFLLTDYDFLYHYWNPFNDQFENISIAQLFRSDYSNYSDTKLPDPPSSNLYTGISLGPAFILFWILFIVYGLIITQIKRKISSDFISSSFLIKFQVRNNFNQLINHSSGNT